MIILYLFPRQKPNMTESFSIPLVFSSTSSSSAASFFIGRFSDPVNAEDDMSVTVADEVINEEDVGEDKSTELYKRKQARRRYRKQSKILLGVSNSKSVKFEGSLASTSLDELDTTGLGSSAVPTVAPIKYVLLRMNADKSAAEVIPVDAWYNFRKPAVVGDKFLDEVDDDFELQKKIMVEKNARYRRITSTLQSIDAAAGTQEENGPSQLFGRTKDKKKKPKSGSVRFKAERLMEGDDNEEGEGETALGEEIDVEDQDVEVATDDEEEHLQEMQIEADEQIAQESSRAIIADEEDEVEDSEDEEEDDKATEVGEGEDGRLAGEGEAAKEFRMLQLKEQRMKKVDEELGKRKRQESAESTEGPKRVKAEEGWLRDEEVREYIASVGGRVALKALYRQFKGRVKAAGDAGKARFTDIVKRVTVDAADATHEKLLMLRS